MQNEKDQDPQGRQLNDPPKDQQDQLNERTKNIGEQNTGDSTGQAQAPARERKDEGPSNSGDAGFGSPGNANRGVSTERTEQMSHADGSLSEDPNPDV